MHSFHPSRGRILFEVFCAFAISASCVGAWMQTGAWALLPAALVSALYGLVHLFDIAGRGSAGAADPKRMGSATEPQGGPPTVEDNGVPLAADNQPLTTDSSVEEAEVVDPAAPRANGGRRAKAPRKGAGRRAGAAKQAKVIELATPAEEKVTELADPEESMTAELALPEEAEVPVPPDEVAHVPLAPLFEPEPFARQHRAVFGRKAG
jgi:hypothetical protein